MVRSFAVLAIACLTLTGAGCNSARHVVKEPTGGIIAVPDNGNAWPTYHRDHAEVLMRAHLPAGYEVYREEEVVTGVVTRTNASEKTREVGKNVTIHDNDHTSETHNTTEWHIHYRAR